MKLPLEIGTRVDCRWRDGEYHPARVIEKRPVEGTDQHEYYMHYSKCRFLRHFTHAACCLRMQSWKGFAHALRHSAQSSHPVWHRKRPFAGLWCWTKVPYTCSYVMLAISGIAQTTL